mmetsp:Transcript_79310/g.157085  ORF Transcript_79310/g.157085 Transcript_79310/m.157085 type:complete len:223 (+) Transcript_79310:37-705(+)
MSTPAGLYTVLGVSRAASKETIRLAYLRLAKELHPDVNKSTEAPQRFQRLRDAYDVLSDDGRRRDYDRQMEMFTRSNVASGFGRPSMHKPDAPHTADAQHPSSTSYWQVYRRARRAQASHMFYHQSHQRQTEHDFASAHSHYHENFDRSQYFQSVRLTFLRAVPFLLPIWAILFLVSLRRSGSASGSSSGAGMPVVTYDSSGRAYARDAYGRQHRLPDFDRQ